MSSAIHEVPFFDGLLDSNILKDPIYLGCIRMVESKCLESTALIDLLPRRPFAPLDHTGTLGLEARTDDPPLVVRSGPLTFEVDGFDPFHRRAARFEPAPERVEVVCSDVPEEESWLSVAEDQLFDGMEAIVLGVRAEDLKEAVRAKGQGTAPVPLAGFGVGDVRLCTRKRADSLDRARHIWHPKRNVIDHLTMGAHKDGSCRTRTPLVLATLII